MRLLLRNYSIMLVGGGHSAESCSGGIRNSAERGISRGANCQVFAPAVFEIRRAPQETGFLLRRYSIHAEHRVGVLLCGKSSKRKSRAKVHPEERHFEIIRD
jgi:hypothetical protein